MILPCYCLNYASESIIYYNFILQYWHQSITIMYAITKYRYYLTLLNHTDKHYNYCITYTILCLAIYIYSLEHYLVAKFPNSGEKYETSLLFSQLAAWQPIWSLLNVCKCMSYYFYSNFNSLP